MQGTMTIGERIRYLEVIDLLAMGGQYVVAKALDHRSGNLVVIKKPIAIAGQAGYSQHVERAKRESAIRIGDPNVVEALESWEEGGEWYIVMPFVEGDDLQVVADRHKGRLPLKQVMILVVWISTAVLAIHRKGIVHRDIKPANIIIRPNGVPAVCDLGIAKVPDGGDLTQADRLLGSPEWMSPEQVLNPADVDHRTDLYSLGAVAYFLLTGQTPIPAGPAATVLLNVCQHTPPSPRMVNSAVPLHADRAVMRLLAKDRNARFAAAEDFLNVWNGATPQVGPSPEICISCGASIQPGGFCSSCGAQAAAVAASQSFCFACGADTAEASHCPRCRRSFGHSDHRLCFLAGTMAGKTFRVPEGSYDVGRGELSPRDGHISRRHVRVVCLNGSVQLEDAGSTNKTYVAGRQVDHPVLLKRGLEIVIAGNVASYSSK